MIIDKVLEGLPLDDILIFDVHGHLQSDCPLYQGDDDGEGIIKTLDCLGVNSICVSSGLAMESDNIKGNKLTSDTALRYAGRIYGYAVANPYYGYEDFEKWFVKRTGMIGIKIHGAINRSEIKSSGYAPYMELADKLEIPVLFHAWEPSETRQACDLTKKYKNVKIILGHSGMTSYEAKKEAIEGCKSCDNIFVDTAISSTYDGAIEWIVSKIGADRVLYGSDLPFFDCRQTFGKVALSNISESDKIKIFGENAKKIFKNL